VLAGRAVPEIAAAFHMTLAAQFVEAVRRISNTTGLQIVALSGGVFQNRLLLHLMRDMLRRSGFEVLSHRQVPANDGGLSLGQAVVALHQLVLPNVTPKASRRSRTYH
jgi:hydrogenase maturation protein HypF